ncbi:Bifunctional enzyme CysN/CysC [subsurface metagenome]
MAKDVLRIVFTGHVDHGKSTMIGRLLLDTNSLPKEKIAEIKKVSEDLGRDAELAYITDYLKEERENLITIDTTQIFFKSRRRNYVIIDAPGHVVFIKNMISGASQAEAAVLLVDVQEGVMEQTRRHAYLIHMLGIKKIIVVINKMDLINFREELFNRVKNDINQFYESLSLTTAYTIPISARDGVNISKKSPRMKWYKGPCFLSALDSLRLDGKREMKPLRLPIQDSYTINNEEIIVGRVESGRIAKNEQVVVLPSLKQTRVRAIKTFGKIRRSAGTGESIGVQIEGNMSIRRGCIIVHKGDITVPADTFKATIFWMSSGPLHINKKFVIQCSTQEAECSAEKIEKRINSSTLEIIGKDEERLFENEVGEVFFRTNLPILIEKFSFIEELGRFILKDENGTKAAGIITEIPVKDHPQSRWLFPSQKAFKGIAF